MHFFYCVSSFSSQSIRFIFVSERVSWASTLNRSLFESKWVKCSWIKSSLATNLDHSESICSSSWVSAKHTLVSETARNIHDWVENRRKYYSHFFSIKSNNLLRLWVVLSLWPADNQWLLQFISILPRLTNFLSFVKVWQITSASFNTFEKSNS